VSSTEQHSVELKAALAAAIGSISVGFVPFFVIGLQQGGVDTVSLLLWRYLIALSILVPLGLAFHRLTDEWHKGGRWLVANGLLVGTFQVYCYFKAIETLPTSVVITIFYCYPVLTLLIDRVVFRIPVSAVTLVAVAGIIGGVGLTSLPGFASASLDPTGVTYAVLAAVVYAIYIAASYPLTRNVAPIASAVFIYGSFATTFAAAAFVNGFAMPPTQDLWLNLLFIGTLGGALQVLSFAYALPRLAASGYAVIVCLEVVTVVLAGVILLGETLLAVQWLGIVLVLAGIAITRTRRRRIPISPPSTAAAVTTAQIAGATEGDAAVAPGDAVAEGAGIRGAAGVPAPNKEP
jgi:drug/metabolite transporter (DMT)-like permease